MPTEIETLKAQVEALTAKVSGSSNIAKEIVDELRNGATPDRAQLSAEDQRRLSTPHDKAARSRRIECKSLRTSSLFMATVVESRDKAKFPHGRIVAIGPHRMPVGRYTHQSAGGIVPDGFPIMQDARAVPNVPDGEEISPDRLHLQYRVWRTKEFYVTDLREYNGAPMTKDLCRDPKGLDTPWDDAKTRDQAAE